MDKYSNNQPNAAKLLESLRSSGYDNYSAIADLIDNSFDANADVIKVGLGETKGEDYLLTISDNGEGMDERLLDQALRLGSVSDRDNESLGKYGMGLITNGHTRP
jgi:signal transduction histidine kinase